MAIKHRSDSVLESEKFPFPTKLNHLLEERNVTQQMLADHLGVTRQSISKYIHGQTVPDIYTAQRIADYFHVSVGYLIADERVNAIYDSKEFERYCKKRGGEKFYNICAALLQLTDEAQSKVLERIEELKEVPRYNLDYYESMQDNPDYK